MEAELNKRDFVCHNRMEERSVAMKNILFVCTGNTCRSPMAEALLKAKLENVNVKSAGLYAIPNGPVNEHTIQVLNEQGMAYDQTSQPLDIHLVQWADLILTMTENHVHHVLSELPEAAGKIYTLKQYVSDGQASDRDVVDPFGGNLARYRATLAELSGLVDKLVKKIKHHDR